jgi:hypothetical protein
VIDFFITQLNISQRKEMAGKSLNFELDDGDSVTMHLSNSARISLTDITAATIGNLAEDSQWEDNSVTDTGAAVLRPWEDNSNSDKSDMITPIVVSHIILIYYVWHIME